MEFGNGSVRSRSIVVMILFILFLEACKKDKSINIDDAPKAPRSGSSNGRGSGGFGTDPKSETPDSEATVDIDVRARTEKPLSTEERVTKAELALSEMKDQLVGAKDETLSKKWDIALTSWSAIPKIKPEDSIQSFCNDLKVFVDAAITDAGLSANNKGKIGDAYIRLLNKNEGLCTAK